MPLADFPPLHFPTDAPRLLTDAEAAGLMLRERVREYRLAHPPLRRGFKRMILAGLLAVLCLPTVERIVLHLDDYVIGSPSTARIST